MSANTNGYTLQRGVWALAIAAMISLPGLLGVHGQAQAQAQERLPWEAPAYGSPAPAYGSDANAPGAIRQPRSDPYYAPPRRSSTPRPAARPYDNGNSARYDSGRYDPAPHNNARAGNYRRNNGNRQDYAPRRFERSYGERLPSRAPYADPNRAADLPPYYNDNRYDGPPSSQANYNGNSQQRYDSRAPDGTYSVSEIRAAGHNFFGSISKGLASVIEYAFKRSGRPNGYILGEGAGGAFIAGLRYGEGTLYTKHAGRHKVYWQGPSIGYDAGAEGSKTMVLIYNLRRPSDLFKRYGGVDGSAYLIGGVGITFLSRDKVILAPIKAGVGLRFGANVGYLKYTRRPTWNPF